MSSDIRLQALSLAYPQKVLVDGFDASIPYGSRIALIGKNGSGKSSLLRVLAGVETAYEGHVTGLSENIIGYVPQIIVDEQFDHLSGGQRFQAMLTQALSQWPDVLLLDEPTNHLDESNIRSLIRMLQHFSGTLIVVSHDERLLQKCFDTFWLLEDGQVNILHGAYDDVLNNQQQILHNIIETKRQLKQQQKATHQALMQEQQRSARSRRQGQKAMQQKKYAPVVGHEKAREAQNTAGTKKAVITQKQQELSQQLTSLRQAEVIVPKFHLNAGQSTRQSVLSVSTGQVAYQDTVVLENVYLDILRMQRIAITGDNGCGKSLLLKAILQHAKKHSHLIPIHLQVAGDWIVPAAQNIAYLDQHYQTLNLELNVIESIEMLVPEWTHAQVRQHLNDFLFRSNEEVYSSIEYLSGGEKMRLCLAQIAAQTPALLLLDELTNNLDRETRAHVIEVLRHFPGAMILISHDRDFLERIEVDSYYRIEKKSLVTE